MQSDLENNWAQIEKKTIDLHFKTIRTKKYIFKNIFLANLFFYK